MRRAFFIVIAKRRNVDALRLLSSCELPTLVSLSQRQWDKFNKLVADGAQRTKVFAQLDDKWTEVGDVAVEASGTPAQAAQYNKRLILEHAVRVNPGLMLRARELKTGIAGASGEAELLGKQEVPDGLITGFEGLPDASGKYAKVRGATMTSDPTAIVGSTARD